MAPKTEEFSTRNEKSTECAVDKHLILTISPTSELKKQLSFVNTNTDVTSGESKLTLCV